MSFLFNNYNLKSNKKSINFIKKNKIKQYYNYNKLQNKKSNKLNNKKNIKKFINFIKYNFNFNTNKLFYIYYKITQYKHYKNYNSFENDIDYASIINFCNKRNIISRFRNLKKKKIKFFNKKKILLQKIKKPIDSIKITNVLQNKNIYNIFNVKPSQFRYIKGKYKFKKFKVNSVKIRIRKKFRSNFCIDNKYLSLNLKNTEINKLKNYNTPMFFFRKEYKKYLFFFGLKNIKNDFFLLVDMLLNNTLSEKKKKIEDILFNIKNKIKKIKNYNNKIKYIMHKKKKIKKFILFLKNKISSNIRHRYYERQKLLNFFIESIIIKKKLLKKKKFRFIRRRFKLYKNKKRKFKFSFFNNNKLSYDFFEKKYYSILKNKINIIKYKKSEYKSKLFFLYTNTIKYIRIFNTLLNFKKNISSYLYLKKNILCLQDSSSLYNNKYYLFSKWVSKLNKDITTNVLYKDNINNNNIINKYLENINLYSNNKSYNLKTIKQQIYFLFNKISNLLYHYNFNKMNDDLLENFKHKYKQFSDTVYGFYKLLYNNNKTKDMYVEFIRLKCKYILLKKMLYKSIYLNSTSSYNKKSVILKKKYYFNIINSNKKKIYKYKKIHGYKNQIHYNYIKNKMTNRLARTHYILFIYRYIYSKVNNVHEYINIIIPYLNNATHLYINNKKNILDIVLTEMHSNARYFIQDNNKILHSRSVGSLGFIKKDQRMKKWRKKLGEHLTYWVSKKLKKKKFFFINILTKGKRKIVKFLYYKLKYYLRKRSRKIIKMHKYQYKQIKYQFHKYQMDNKKQKNTANKKKTNKKLYYKIRNNIKNTKIKSY